MEEENIINTQKNQEKMEVVSSEELPNHNNEGDQKHNDEVPKHSEGVHPKLSEEEHQQQTFVARERFLRLMLAAENSKCKLQMYENTTVQGTFVSTDVTFENLIVKDLQTPIAVYENACLRTSDIISFKLDVKM